MRRFLVLGCLLAFTWPAKAQAPIDAPEAEEMARIMRVLVLAAMPNPLVAQEFDWGKQRMSPIGIKWERNGLILKPKTMEKLANDGTWRKIRVEADDADKNMMLDVKNVQQPEKGKLTFDVLLTLKTNIKFEQQIWKAGHRLYSGETRARCRPILKLKVESTSRTEKTGGLIPDLVFRMRVTEANLSYDNLVVEHTAGVGGEAAKILGEAMHDCLNKWKPSLERDMLARANQAIVKAGDTKEIRISLAKLLDAK